MPAHLPLPSKEQIALLPPFVGLPPERICVPQTADDFALAVSELLAEACVGFDSESKPLFTKGHVSDGPHVVQFATLNKAFIFQLHRSTCHSPLLDLLLAPGLIKVGFDLKSDCALLQQKLGVRPQAVLDLVRQFRRAGYGSSLGVKTAVALVLQQRFQKSKKVSTSNWALPRLQSNQLSYAANDAYAAIRVFAGLALAREDWLVTV